MARDRSDAQPGARAVGGEPKKKRSILPLLLGLLLVIALIALLIILLSSDDKKKSSGSGASGNGTLTADGQSILPGAGKGKLTKYNGQKGEGRGVVVQSIVKGEGFWVGTSQSDRVYVEYGGDVGQNENGYKPQKTGVKVNLNGPVRAAPEQPAKNLKLSPADAQLVESEGIYINADNVEAAK